MTWNNEWNKWLNHNELQSELKEQMNDMTEREREDAFYKQLEFGTGGMSGELGAGPNRMNIYSIRKVTAGLAKYIERNGIEPKRRGVVIAYDSRHQSSEFTLEAAKTLGMHGIKTYVFQELRPMPELSFAIRYLRAYAGIMITASHNPAEYNGYKVYGEDGAQLSPAEIAGAALENIEDYQSGKRTNLFTAQQEVINLTSSNVLKFWLKDGSWFAIRPSGTEPKVKFYFGLKQATENRSEKRLQEIQANVMSAVENTIYT